MPLDAFALHEFKSFVRDLLAAEQARHEGLDDPRLRRSDVMCVLDHHESFVRRRCDHMRTARARAVWDASWQLRKEIADALDHCEQAERDARWSREE